MDRGVARVASAPNFLQNRVVLHVAFFAALIVLAATLADLNTGELAKNWGLWKAIPGAAGVLVAAWAAGNSNEPLTYFLNLLVIVVVTPSMVVTVYFNLPADFPAVTLISFLVLVATARLIRLKNITLPIFRSAVVMWCLLLISAIYLLATIFFGAGKYINLDLSSIYQLRSQINALMPPQMTYARFFVSDFAVPAVSAIALTRKNWLCFGLSMLAGILILALTANKAPALYPLVVAAIYFLSRRKHPIISTLWLTLAVLAISLLDQTLFLLKISPFGVQSGWISSIIVGRGLLVPSALNWAYMDFFTHTDIYYWWSNSKLTFGLIHQPYYLEPPNLIGTMYLYRPNIAASIGYFGSGFANGGFFGLGIYTVAVGLFLAILKAAGRVHDPAFVTSFFALPVLTITTGSDFVTTLTTHGAIFSVLLVIFLKPIDAETGASQVLQSSGRQKVSS